MSSNPSDPSSPPSLPSAPVFYVKPFFSPAVAFDSRLLSISGLCKKDSPTQLASNYKQVILKVALRSLENYLDEYSLDSDHSARQALTDLLLTSSDASTNVRHYVSLTSWDSPDHALSPSFLQARVQDMLGSSDSQPSFPVLVVFSGQARRFLRAALGSHAVAPSLTPIPEDPHPLSSPPDASALASAVAALTTLLRTAVPVSPPSADGLLPTSTGLAPPSTISPAFCRNMGVSPLTPSAVLHHASPGTSRVSLLPDQSHNPLTSFGQLRRQPHVIPSTPGSLPPFSLPSGDPSPATPVISPPASSPAPAPAPPEDPAWDSAQRAGFSYPMGLSPLLAHRSSLPPLRQGTTWQYYQCDVNDVTDMIVDASTGTIFPWSASRPDHGVLVHFPLRTSAIHMDRELFLANLSNRGFDTKNQKYFQLKFPVLDPAAIANFPYWWNRVVQHTQNYGGFIPPLHTLRPNCPLGIWFTFLPPHIQAEIQTTFADLLVICIQGKTSGLSSSHALIERLIRESTNGYWLLYELAIHAGSHPLLDDSPSLPPEPRQRSDMPLSDYVSAWRRYIHYAVLSGKFLSDRFFYYQFLRHLDPFPRSLLESRLDLDLRAFPLGTPLPLSFDPDHLLSRLTRYARFLGRLDLLDKSPRDLSRGSVPIHALSSSSDDLLLAALDAGSTRSCFICGAVDHLVADCPLLLKLRRDPTSRRLLSRLL